MLSTGRLFMSVGAKVAAGTHNFPHRNVWHAGYLDSAAAESIASEIKEAEKRLQRLRDLGATSATATSHSIHATEAELHELRNKYEHIAGEAYDDYDEQAKEGADQPNTK